MLKRDSMLWFKAKKYAKRKHTNSFPILLSDCGNFVTMQSLIYGNKWTITEYEVNQLLNRKEIK